MCVLSLSVLVMPYYDITSPQQSHVQLELLSWCRKIPPEQSALELDVLSANQYIPWEQHHHKTLLIVLQNDLKEVGPVHSIQGKTWRCSGHWSRTRQRSKKDWLQLLDVFRIWWPRILSRQRDRDQSYVEDKYGIYIFKQAYTSIQGATIKWHSLAKAVPKCIVQWAKLMYRQHVG